MATGGPRRAAGLLLFALAGLTGCPAPGGRTGSAPELPAAEAQLVADRDARVYHYFDCRYARDIPEEQLIGFRRPDDAERRGFVPCAFCRPRERLAPGATGHPASQAPPAPGGTP